MAGARWKGARGRLSGSAFTLLEMVVSVAILAVIFAAVLPQFRNIQNSWNSRQENTGVLQNSRILLDHLNSNLSKAVKVTSVSDPTVTNGFIEIQANDGATYRWAVSADGTVQYGPVGSLSDLAGAVSRLQFSCYGLQSLDTPTTDVYDIRLVQVTGAVTNPSPLGRDENLATSVLLRANGRPPIIPFDPFRFSSFAGRHIDLCRIDDNHFLCVYASGYNGWAVILGVNDSGWTVSRSVRYRFTTSNIQFPTLAKIDDTHYLCAYTDGQLDGMAFVLAVNPVNWTMAGGPHFEFDDRGCRTPDIGRIDNEHYLCAYEGKSSEGWAVILLVDTVNWTVSKEPYIRFHSIGLTPSLVEIDGTHFICAYTDENTDGRAVTFEVDLGAGRIYKKDNHEFEKDTCIAPHLAKIDNAHYLCVYEGPDNDGWALVLGVDSDWKVIENTPFEFDAAKGRSPALCKTGDNDFVCAYVGQLPTAETAYALGLTVNPADWTVSRKTIPFQYAQTGLNPVICKIDQIHYLCGYEAAASAGYAIVMEVDLGINP